MRYSLSSKRNQCFSSLPRTGFRKMNGYIMIEVAVAMLVAAGISLGLHINNMRQAEQSVAKAGGQQLRYLANAVNTYIVDYNAALIMGQPIAGVADPYNPTIAELKTLTGPAGPRVSGNFTNRAVLGGGQFQITLRNVGTCPNCDYEGLVYITQPVMRGSKPNHSVINLAVLEMGADGGQSTTDNPSAITGLGASWTYPNQLGSVAGGLAMRVGYGTTMFAAMLPRDGSRPMTGGLNMGTNSISGASNVTATGTLQGNSVQGNNISATGSINTPIVQFQPGVGGNVADGQACSTVGVTQANSDGKLWTCQNVSGSLRWKAPSDGQSGVPKTANFLQQYAGRSGSFCEYGAYAYICTNYVIYQSGVSIYVSNTGASAFLTYSNPAFSYNLNGFNPVVLTTVNLTPAGISYSSTGSGCLLIQSGSGAIASGTGAILYITPDMLDAGNVNMSGQTIWYILNEPRCAYGGVMAGGTTPLSSGD